MKSPRWANIYIYKYGLTKIQAIILEQQYINKYGIRSVYMGGQLYNRINSIAPKYWNQYNIQHPLMLRK